MAQKYYPTLFSIFEAVLSTVNNIFNLFSEQQPKPSPLMFCFSKKSKSTLRQRKKMKIYLLQVKIGRDSVGQIRPRPDSNSSTLPIFCCCATTAQEDLLLLVVYGLCSKNNKPSSARGSQRENLKTRKNYCFARHRMSCRQDFGFLASHINLVLVRCFC